MRVHFIAVGGAAMHSLALALHRQGHTVTGSDDVIADPSRRRLAEAGLLPAALGWHPERIVRGLDAVILGMHAARDNPELERALQLGLRIWSFPEYLYRETAGKLRAVVGGSHGKTTVTALVMHALRGSGRGFDYVVGAELQGFETMVGLDPAAALAVFEGDEYPASAIDPRPKFHIYRPHLALLNGIAWDHANVFANPEIYEKQFAGYIEQVVPGGTLIYNGEDPAVCRVARFSRPDVVRIEYRTPPYRIVAGRYHVQLGGIEVDVPLLGRHNMLNLAAAHAMCRELGLTDREFAAAAMTFRGAARRLQPLVRHQKTVIFLDFAHAPSKVRATVDALREAFPGSRLIAVLELHTYSSVRPDFIVNYRGTLDPADHAVVFVAPETCRRKGVAPLTDPQVRAAFGHPELEVVTDRPVLEQWLREVNLCNTVLVLMSSGSFGGIDLHTLLSERQEGFRASGGQVDHGEEGSGRS